MKILLIDDKDVSNLGYGAGFYKALSFHLRTYIDFLPNIVECIKINSNQEVELQFEENEYSFVFLHDSYTDSKLDLSQIQQFSDLVENRLFYFSGRRNNDRSKNEITRESLFLNLERCLQMRHLTGAFDLNILYDVNYNPYIKIYDKLEEIIVEYGVDDFLDSQLLSVALGVSGYNSEQIGRAKERMKNMDEAEILELLNDLKINL